MPIIIIVTLIIVIPAISPIMIFMTLIMNNHDAYNNKRNAYNNSNNSFNMTYNE